MAVSREEVRRIAALARLHFTDDEEAQLADQLSTILGYVGTLDELDTSAVPPMTHVLDLFNVYRDDEPEARITREEALSAAPDADEAFFRVPKVID